MTSGRDNAKAGRVIVLEGLDAFPLLRPSPGQFAGLVSLAPQAKQLRHVSFSVFFPWSSCLLRADCSRRKSPSDTGKY